MKYFKYLLAIYLTNWVNLLGVLVGTGLSVIFAALFQFHESAKSVSELLTELLMTPVFLLTYGLIPIGLFLLALVILDTICFFQKTQRLRILLLIQWLLIILKPILWAFEYSFWLWVGLSISFFVTQLLREKKIKNIQGKYFNSFKY